MSDAITYWEDQPASLQAARDRAKAAAVVHLVALATGAAPRQMLDPRKARGDAVRARWLAVYLTHVGFSIPLARVAAAFGRDRTTVSYAIHKVEDWREEASFDLTVSALEACVSAMPAEAAPFPAGGAG